jgi:hypothetical protein
MIDAMLNRYIDKNDLLNNELEDEEFFDFDDFDDFDDFSDNEIIQKKDMMTKFNESHKKIPAKEFLEDYQDLDYILEDLEDMDEIMHHIVTELDGISLEDILDDIGMVFTRYSRFLNSFIDFYELSTSLVMLEGVLENADYSNMQEKHKEFVAEFIKSIFKDLSDWKEHVFIQQDAIDVFYINASSLNSCIQLEAFIKEHS